MDEQYFCLFLREHKGRPRDTERERAIPRKKKEKTGWPSPLYSLPPLASPWPPHSILAQAEPSKPSPYWPLQLSFRDDIEQMERTDCRSWKKTTGRSTRNESVARRWFAVTVLLHKGGCGCQWLRSLRRIAPARDVLAKKREEEEEKRRNPDAFRRGPMNWSDRSKALVREIWRDSKRADHRRVGAQEENLTMRPGHRVRHDEIHSLRDVIKATCSEISLRRRGRNVIS